MSKEEAKKELIKVLEEQVIQLTMMSKIELGDDVIKEIKRLKEIINKPYRRKFMLMNNIDRQYKELLEYILRFGVDKKDRTGTGTKSIFGWQIRHRMEEGFPLLTTKKMYWKGIVTELLWFLRGDTNIKYLVDNDCNIWNGDCYQAYLKECERLEKENKD